MLIERTASTISNASTTVAPPPSTTRHADSKRRIQEAANILKKPLPTTSSKPVSVISANNSLSARMNKIAEAILTFLRNLFERLSAYFSQHSNTFAKAPPSLPQELQNQLTEILLRINHQIQQEPGDLISQYNALSKLNDQLTALRATCQTSNYEIEKIQVIIEDLTKLRKELNLLLEESKTAKEASKKFSESYTNLKEKLSSYRVTIVNSRVNLRHDLSCLQQLIDKKELTTKDVQDVKRISREIAIGLAQIDALIQSTSKDLIADADHEFLETELTSAQHAIQSLKSEMIEDTEMSKSLNEQKENLISGFNKKKNEQNIPIRNKLIANGSEIKRLKKECETLKTELSNQELANKNASEMRVNKSSAQIKGASQSFLGAVAASSLRFLSDVPNPVSEKTLENLRDQININEKSIDILEKGNEQLRARLV